MVLKIAFGYKMSAGKDTAVEYLINKYDGRKISFASPIYKIMDFAQRVCGLPTKKDRRFLQLVGTDWGRNINSDIWINLALDEARKSAENVFISDLRFPNELNALKKDGWVCVKINRNQIESGRVGSGTHTHLSEISLENTPDNEWYTVIDNNGTKEEFYAKLDKIVKDIPAD